MRRNVAGVVLVIVGILAVAGWGAYRLTRAPGPAMPAATGTRERGRDCYYFLRTSVGLCVTARPLKNECLAGNDALDQMGRSIACFGDSEKATAFVKNAGKRICGTSSVADRCPGAGK